MHGGIVMYRNYLYDDIIIHARFSEDKQEMVFRIFSTKELKYITEEMNKKEVFSWLFDERIFQIPRVIKQKVNYINEVIKLAEKKGSSSSIPEFAHFLNNSWFRNN